MARPIGSKDSSPRKLVPAIDRLLARIPDRQPDECWVWPGKIAKEGYGRIQSGGHGNTSRQVLTHRVTYESLVGPVPHGLELDHLCRVRACCNPAHLEPVTRAENLRRGLHRNGFNDDPLLCRRGHPWSYRKNGHRRCLVCCNTARRERRANRRAEQKEAA